MTHTITEADIERGMVLPPVLIASSGGPAGLKRLAYHHDRAMFVLTVNNKFLMETSEAKRAAAEYSAVEI